MSKEKYILVLTGKTGVGKSALGNAILGEEKFTSRDSSTSVTTECLLESANRSDLNITVIDTYGFMDTGEDANGAKLKAVKEMKDLMVKCPTDGKLAVIFVIKYGERNTEENRITLQILQSIFGREHIWKSCIIVMTTGEMFDLNYARKKSFKQYMQDETGELGELFKMCNYKCVLFYNKTKDEKQKTEQFNTLIQYVKELDQVYTTSKFKDAQREQNRLELESKLSNYEKEFQHEIDQIKEKLDNLNLTSESLDDLTKINDIINQNLEMVDGIDTPKEIYYESGETRLLDKIRKSLEYLKQKTSKNKEIIHQLNMKDELENKINEILDNMKKTNAQQNDINKIMMGFENELTKMGNIKVEGTLKIGNADYIFFKLKHCKQELELLKIKVQLQNEKEINLKIQDFIQRLNKTELEDIQNHELFLELKNEFKSFKLNFEQEQICFREDFFKTVEVFLNKIKKDIKEKEDTMMQWSKANEMEKDIIKIKNQIKSTNTDVIDVDIKLYCVKASLNEMVVKLQKANLRKNIQAKIYNLIIIELQELKILKYKVKQRKEKEIYKSINELSERLKRLEIMSLKVLNK